MFVGVRIRIYDEPAVLSQACEIRVELVCTRRAEVRIISGVAIAVRCDSIDNEKSIVEAANSDVSKPTATSTL
jgi:hypothetical protein